MKIILLPLIQIAAGNNDRKKFKAAPMLELAESIAEYGLAQPITVRWHDGKKKYVIVAGERRFRAHLIYNEKVNSGEWPLSPRCELGTIQAIVRDDLADEQASGIMLIENVQREDLDPMEEARAYQTRIDDYGWSITKLAKLVKKSGDFIKQRLMLLGLAPALQALISSGELKPIYGEEIAALPFNQQMQVVAWLNKQSYLPTRQHINRFVSKLLEQSSQDSLFDFNSLFAASAVAVAQSNEGKRVSDCLTPLEYLPTLPLKKGDVGIMTDAYIAHLMEAGFDHEAAILMDFWRKMMKANKLQIKPWDSKVLPLL